MRFDCKADTIRAMRMGLFGNAPRHWETIHDVVSDVGVDTPVVVRPRSPGGVCIYDITARALNLSYNGLDLSGFYFNEPLDQSAVTLNAEIARSVPGGVALTYATTQQHMRPALRDASQHVRGLKALMIMRHYACDKGCPVIEELMNEYPDHVIEFTCTSRPYGVLGWKTVVWEVRSY